jgi:menaquinone-dependent protoporphyrinogen oxidase
MKILAVYGSNYGQAQAVLGRVTSALEARGHAVSAFKGDAIPADLAVEDFDAVVVAASIRMGRYQTYIRDFLKRHGAALTARPTAFVSVNGTRPESAPEWRAESQGYVQEFLKETGLAPRWTANFAGALRYPRYDFVTRWIMKGISRRRGGPTDTSQEYEYTDWRAVDRFAEDLAGALGGQVH